MRALIALLGVVMAPLTASAAPLSEVALYHRCFVRLTGAFPDYVEDEGLAQVRSGEVTAAQACMAVFDRATLRTQGTTERLMGDDELSAMVLSTFHNLHASWFLNRTFPNNDDVSLGTEALYDATEPAGYITQALFNPEVPASSILTASEHLRVLREVEEPYLYEEVSPQDFLFPNAPVLPLGPIMGVERAGLLSRSYRLEFEDEDVIEDTLDIGAHLGGGFLGSSTYLLLTVNETLEFRANGGRKMPRKWAKAVLEDALCRELPVVRIEDAIPYVVTDSAVPFRRQTRCTQCHSSIDRIASTIRGFGYTMLFEEDETGFRHGGIFAAMGPVSQPPETGWPAVEDLEYSERPPQGRLYFRDHEGQLVDLPLDGPAQLGARLAELDGPYICLAKRYYRYFTGIDAYIGDPENFPAASESRDAHYRRQVIELGRQLRTTGDLRGLIEAILLSADYRESDFGASQ